MTLTELAAFLKELPEKAWQCGKIVAAQQAAVRGPNDGPAIDDNCDRLKSILGQLKLEVFWWPSA
jgi:hypothetical protein